MTICDNSIAISQDLKEFFNKDPNNFITFWNCSSNNKWYLYYLVNNFKGKNFLELNNDNNKPINPTYTKDRS